MLNLLLKPNGYVPPGANQQYNANFISNETPQHNRIDYVYRGDVVLTKNLRFSGKVLADQENNIRVNAFGPGFGRVEQHRARVAPRRHGDVPSSIRRWSTS